MGAEQPEDEGGDPISVKLSCGHNYKFADSDNNQLVEGSQAYCEECTIESLGQAKAIELGSEGMSQLPPEQKIYQQVTEIIKP